MRPEWPKRCSMCSRMITEAEWATLQWIGRQEIPADSEDPALTIELRNDTCGTTLAIEVEAMSPQAAYLRHVENVLRGTLALDEFSRLHDRWLMLPAWVRAETLRTVDEQAARIWNAYAAPMGRDCNPRS
jgi:hypothetical protein